MEELYEMKDDLANCKTGAEYINKLIDEYQEDKALHSTERMMWNKYFYTIGAIDALYYSGKINQQEYTNFLKYFGV
jgi:N-methylhydantoinase B/oxoprolinase/acetone carboxylase alpha subunit